MLIRKGSQWQLYPHKVNYTQHGIKIEQWALPNKQWWVDFANKWNHTKVIEFTEVDLTEEQIARFEEIKDMPEDFMNMYTEYIITGDTSDEIELPTNHPFNIVRLKNEKEILERRTAAAESAIVTLMDINLMGGM